MLEVDVSEWLIRLAVIVFCFWRFSGSSRKRGEIETRFFQISLVGRRIGFAGGDVDVTATGVRSGVFWHEYCSYGSQILLMREKSQTS